VAKERVSVSMKVQIAYTLSEETNLDDPVTNLEYVYKVKQSVCTFYSFDNV